MTTNEPVGGLKAVFVEQRAMLMRLFVARLQSRDDAEDALQDMWLKLDSLDTRPVAQPAAYLYRMAANLASDRRIAALRDGRRDTAWLDVQPIANEFADAERELIGRDALTRLNAIMDTMPERMRLALRLFRIEEMPQREIAARLGITVSGVEKLLKRAYRLLHDSWDAASADQAEQNRLSGKEDIGRDE